jgi:hypothetical protein
MRRSNVQMGYDEEDFLCFCPFLRSQMAKID